jgi:hypothetical protein
MMMMNNAKLALARFNMAPFRCFTAFSAVSRADVLATTDTKWLGTYVQSVIETGDASGADAVNEYFRKNFRKLSTRQALDVVEAMAVNTGPSAILDGKFWVWETLEEALRAEV